MTSRDTKSGQAVPGSHGRTLECEQCYWEVLDASRLPGRTVSSEQLGFLLEPLVPRPLDELHVLYRPLSGRRYLACAVPLEVLEGQVDPRLTSLRPASLPSFLELEGVLDDEVQVEVTPCTSPAVLSADPGPSVL